jgi:para-nitrobenzyl esterase
MSGRCSFKLLILACGLLAAACQPAHADTSRAGIVQPVIGIQAGRLAGLHENNVEVFRGIPYAAPPVGELRWHAPIDIEEWQGIRPATEFGAACPQPFNLLFADSGEQSEDCLYLNVWTPDHAAQGLPVLVYIHGGAFLYGSGAQRVYDGSAFAARGVVVVTINYRLGVLGFLAHPALSAENDRQTSGNYALLDQLKALQWVQDNIQEFGGDPDKVTIMGESAGSVSICALLCSPLAQGLFQGAIAMSGGAPGKLRDLHNARDGMASMEDIGEQWANRVMHKLELNEFSELRSVTWEKLQGDGDLETLRTEYDLASMMSMDDSICIDGYVLKDSPTAIFRDGKQWPVPLIAGSLEHEGGMFTMGLKFRDIDHYQSTLESIFGVKTPLAQILYPADNPDYAVQQLTQFISDGFATGARALVRDMSDVQEDCWLYRFDYVSPAARLSGVGTFHGSEIPYFLGSFPLPVVYGRGSQLLSDRLGTYLLNFIRSGDPNSEGFLDWPRYQSGDDSFLTINQPMGIAFCKRSRQYELIEQCQLW